MDFTGQQIEIVAQRTPRGILVHVRGEDRLRAVRRAGPLPYHGARRTPSWRTDLLKEVTMNHRDRDLAYIGRDVRTKKPRFLLQQNVPNHLERLLRYIVIAAVVMVVLSLWSTAVSRKAELLYDVDECAQRFEHHGKDSQAYKMAWSTCYQDAQGAAVP